MAGCFAGMYALIKVQNGVCVTCCCCNSSSDIVSCLLGLSDEVILTSPCAVHALCVVKVIVRK
jgi:hypothetical protein